MDMLQRLAKRQSGFSDVLLNAENNLKWNPVFDEVNKTIVRYRVLKGGAGSGKSQDIAQDYICKLSSPFYKGANLLCLRKVNEANEQSTFAELQRAIYLMFGDNWEKYWTVKTSPLYMECRITGNMVVFRGMNDAKQREKVKSINFKRGKLCWIWCEEATDFFESDVDILDDRLRGELPNPNLFYQNTFSFNPVSAAHWLKGKYWDNPAPEIVKCQSTYLDNQFIDDGYRRRMEMRKERDPDGYRVYALGEWGELGGLIFTNYDVAAISDKWEDYDKIYIGQDFGYNHANAILLIGYKGRDIYVLKEIYDFEKDTDYNIARAELTMPKHIMMFCDSAEPKTINRWMMKGWKAMAVRKEPGSVRAQIDWLKGRRIIINTPCVNTIKEIGQWKWRKDEKTNTYLDEPVPFMDDAMAALRYGVEDFRKYSRD